MLIAIHDTGHHRVSIRACANGQEEDEGEGLEIEESGLVKRRLAVLFALK